jgi:hypothetical protein
MKVIRENYNTGCYTQNPVLHGRAKHIKVRHHFLWDHIEKRDIEMKYIDTEGQLIFIFTKPLDVTHFASLRRKLGICHPCGMIWGELVFYLIYTLSYFYCIAFHSYLPNLAIASLIMLACIWLTILVTVLGWVEMRCETHLC